MVLTTKKFGLTLPLELVERIDRVRGLVPRSTFVADLCNRALDKRKNKEAVTS